MVFWCFQGEIECETDLLCKSMDWFLYDRDLPPERANVGSKIWRPSINGTNSAVRPKSVGPVSKFYPYFTFISKCKCLKICKLPFPRRIRMF